MIGGGVSDEVIQYIEQWIPQDHEDEYGFQKGLQTYLDKSINESGNANTHPAFGGGTGQQYLSGESTGSPTLMLQSEMILELIRSFVTRYRHGARN
jgi:hypothetical protein